MIPEDVMNAAQELAIEVECMPSGGNIHAIARAIMAERERCARIAETTETPEDGEYWIAARIAAAIRGAA